MPVVSVVLIGLEPTKIDFSDPAFAVFPRMNADRVMAGLRADEARLKSLGYDISLCLVDFGETAEAVVRERLGQQRFDCVLIGAGVRLIAKHTVLFERLVNAVHDCAPQARICFNTGPTDSAEAVERWFPRKP